MVYPGHPSRGCRTCKIRRIKCGEGRPCCEQCVRSKRSCLGYDLQASRGGVSQRGLSQTHGQTCNVQFVQPSIQSSISTGGMTVHFAENFTKRHGFSPSLPGFLAGVQTVLAATAHHGMLQNLLDVFTLGHISLYCQSQTMDDLYSLRGRYKRAIRDTRQSIHYISHSTTLFLMVYLLALYTVRIGIKVFGIQY